MGPAMKNGRHYGRQLFNWFLKWISRTETLINDRPVVNKVVKWDEKLVERGSEAEYEL